MVVVAVVVVFVVVAWLYRGLVVVSAAGPLFTEAVGVGVGVGAARRSW